MAEPSADDLKALAEMRLGDAQALLAAGRHSAAYYLAGYAVECALKAIIARSFKAAVIPDRSFVLRVYSHNLDELIALADLKPALDAKRKISAAFSLHWSVVRGWSETARYGTVDSEDALVMIQAVASEPEGIVSWLKERW